tara:strand:- start:4557 stop:5018 length:462 start_codon:yes stop_codon:yes gene_type:complete
MKKFRNYIIVFFFIFISSCGYSPLLNSEKNNFRIGVLNFEGDRQINNFIFSNLKKYQNSKNNLKKYNLKIASSYEKIITNKDENGNPKNYNLQIKLNVIIDIEGGAKLNKSFEKNASLSAKSKKMDEKQLEKKYKKNLSISLSEDIIFFLINQ